MENFDRLPRHVSIIMDGNGRWAQSRSLPRFKGHYEGVESVRSVVEECCVLGIPYLSLFAFSEENWSRPADEVTRLMDLMASAMQAEEKTFLKNGVRFVVLGNRERISPKLAAAIDALMAKTADCQRLTLVIFLSYSGKWDILQASRKLAQKYPDGNFGEQEFAAELVTAQIPDPDLLIRTSGEMRISNYLLWQLAYTEIVITDTLWPDFRKEEFRGALHEYEKRDRRFGKVK